MAGPISTDFLYAGAQEGKRYDAQEWKLSHGMELLQEPE